MLKMACEPVEAGRSQGEAGEVGEEIEGVSEIEPLFVPCGDCFGEQGQRGEQSPRDGGSGGEKHRQGEPEENAGVDEVQPEVEAAENFLECRMRWSRGLGGLA